jgi:hypothetical protein
VGCRRVNAVPPTHSQRTVVCGQMEVVCSVPVRAYLLCVKKITPYGVTTNRLSLQTGIALRPILCHHLSVTPAAPQERAQTGGP